MACDALRAAQVPTALPADEQCKERAWLCIGIAETLKFTSVAESKRPSCVAARAALEEAYAQCILTPLVEEPRVGVLALWDPGTAQLAPSPVAVTPFLHSGLFDDPQQHATLRCTGCVYGDCPNSRRACFGDAITARTEANTRTVIEEAMSALEGADGNMRDIEVRVARARLARLGLSWPPRLPATIPDAAPSERMLHAPGWWCSAYLVLHNVGLCMQPNAIQLTWQWIYNVVCAGDPKQLVVLLKREESWALTQSCSHALTSQSYLSPLLCTRLSLWHV